MPNFQHKKILITAGPTYEPIDPVRFIGNRSTGKMGIAIADAFAERQADVTLVLGPTSNRPSNKNITTICVETADEMYKECLKYEANSNIIIMSAAVADYKVKHVATQKIKKSGPNWKPDFLLRSFNNRKTLLHICFDIIDMFDAHR
jgi:phosphopantothenoylcysteine decarboxylase/phosphopantothenate--cysteine ligase